MVLLINNYYLLHLQLVLLDYVTLEHQHILLESQEYGCGHVIILLSLYQSYELLCQQILNVIHKNKLLVVLQMDNKYDRNQVVINYVM